MIYIKNNKRNTKKQEPSRISDFKGMYMNEKRILQQLQAFKSEARLIHEKDYVTHMPHNQLYYHYTTTQNGSEILTTKQIYFTHYRDLDDALEIIGPYEQSREIVEEFVKESENKSFWKIFIEKLYDREALKYISIYVCSLTYARNDSHLFEAFGDNGKGLSIGFNLSPYSIGSGFSDTVITPISYVRKHFVAIVREFLQLTDNLINDSKKYIANRFSVDHPFIRNLRIELACNIISLLPSAVRAGFEDEKEIRLYKIEIIKNGKSHKEIPAEYKIVKDRKRRVIQNFIATDISEVLLGPRNKMLCTDVEKILAANKYDLNNTKIFQS